MKPVLAWVKSNLIIVIALALAIIAIPLGLFFSGRMSAKLREEVQKDVSGAMSQLNGLAVDYTIPAARPGEEAWTLRAAPNPERNRAVEAVLKALTQESEWARETVIRTNQGDKRLLISGSDPENVLFPAPANESSRVRLLTEMADKWVEAHATLLTEARAGMPPDPQQLFDQLDADRLRYENQKVSGRVSQELDAAEKEEIAQQLAQKRLAAYRDRAQRLTFYADPSVFKGVEPWTTDRGVPRLEQAWEWQWVYWFHRDIIAALAKANSEPGKPWIPVTNAPVKRVLEIAVAPFGATGSSSDIAGGRGRGGMDESGEESAPGSPDPNAPIEANFSVSPTGRVAWPEVPNGLYDIRYATVTIIADGNRIPRILSAFASTNLMSVSDIDIRAFDRPEDRAEGFFYGGDPLVIATLRIESVWIRSWMKPWMPAQIRTELGIPEDQPAPEENADDTLS